MEVLSEGTQVSWQPNEETHVCVACGLQDVAHPAPSSCPPRAVYPSPGAQLSLGSYSLGLTDWVAGCRTGLSPGLSSVGRALPRTVSLWPAPP